MTFHVPLHEWFDLARACNAVGDSESLFQQLIFAMNRIGAEKVIYVHWPPFGTDPVRDPLTLCACGFPDDMLVRYAASRLWERSRNVTRAIETGVPFYAGRSLPETPGWRGGGLVRRDGAVRGGIRRDPGDACAGQFRGVRAARSDGILRLLASEERPQAFAGRNDDPSKRRPDESCPVLLAPRD